MKNMSLTKPERVPKLNEVAKSPLKLPQGPAQPLGLLYGQKTTKDQLE